MTKILWEPDLDAKKTIFEYCDMIFGDREKDPDTMTRGKIYAVKLGARRWPLIIDQYERYKRLQNPVDFVDLLKEDLGDRKTKIGSGTNTGVAI